MRPAKANPNKGGKGKADFSPLSSLSSLQREEKKEKKKQDTKCRYHVFCSRCRWPIAGG